MTRDQFVSSVKPATREYIGDDVERTTIPMFAATILILLIACANVANLFMAHFLRRIKELTVRQALGANRRHIIRQVITETLIVCTGGTVIGVLIADYANGWIRQTMVIMEPPNWIDFSIDGRVLIFALVVMLLSTLLASLAPVWMVTRIDLNSNLKDDSRSSSGYHGGRD